MAATVGWPKEEWGFNPGSYSELRPGCFDVHERVRDMNANGVLASMNFPTMAGFNARTFTEGERQGARRSSCSRPTTTGPSTSGAAPTRAGSSRWASSPCGTSTSPSRRCTGVAKKGCRSISFLETPHVQGFPSFLSGHWDPMFQALCDDEHGPVAAHRRRLRGHQPARRGADRPPHGARLPDHAPSPRRTCSSARPCASSPTSRSPCPRAASAGSRSTSTASTATSRTRRGCTAATTSAARCRPRCSASTSSPATSPTRRAC